MRRAELEEIQKCKAIVMFGPPSDTDGMRPATFFQVTLDPKNVSPNGDYIRFGLTPGDEIVGWQRISSMTICEILGAFNEDGTYPQSDDKPETLQMMVVRE